MVRIRHPHRQRGGAIFYVLIGLAMLGMLSYALRPQGQAGATADKEQARLDATVLMNQGLLIKNFVSRVYAGDVVDQVRLDASAYNAGGTIYDGAGGTTTGRTIGVFNAGDGLPLLYHKAYPTEPPDNGRNWHIEIARVRVGGVDVGTSAGDEVLTARYISQEICAAINKIKMGSETIPTFAGSGGSNGRQEYALRDGTFTSSTTFSIYDVGALPGCNVVDSNPAYFIYFELLRKN
ncbi:MAG: hypothetical protein OXT65_08115 [Alphaproteobacteria bacterium]|nr:hypothetical protein [Alphaproteobacteria bacterium]